MKEDLTVVDELERLRRLGDGKNEAKRGRRREIERSTANRKNSEAVLEHFNSLQRG